MFAKLHEQRELSPHFSPRENRRAGLGVPETSHIITYVSAKQEGCNNLRNSWGSISLLVGKDDLAELPPVRSGNPILFGKSSNVAKKKCIHGSLEQNKELSWRLVPTKQA